MLQDVLILSRMTYLSLSGLARDRCSFILRKLKDDFKETIFVVKVMPLAPGGGGGGTRSIHDGGVRRIFLG